MERLQMRLNKGTVSVTIHKIADRQFMGKPQTRFKPERHALQTFSMSVLLKSHNSQPHRLKQ